MTATILTIKRVFTMRTLMQNFERKCQGMQVEIDSFMEIFAILHERGFAESGGKQ